MLLPMPHFTLTSSQKSEHNVHDIIHVADMSQRTSQICSIHANLLFLVHVISYVRTEVLQQQYIQFIHHIMHKYNICTLLQRMW